MRQKRIKSKERRLCVICLISIIMTLFQNLNFVLADSDNIGKEFFVSDTGSDENDGLTRNSPFKTIEKAQKTVREYTDDMNGDIIVHIGKGSYFLKDTLRFTTADSGKNGYRVIYRGEELPLLSGGIRIDGFVPSEYEGIYKAPVNGLAMMREMYVNGRKAYVASSNRQVKGTGYFSDPKTIYKCDGMYMSRSDIGEFENPGDIEFSWQINWKNNTCLVKDIIPDPENSDQVIVLMQQDWWDKEVNLSDSSLAARPERPFLMKNAFELLDKPGEFYYNKKEKYVYYIPREGEDMENAEVYAPLIDRIISFDGDDSDKRVENISIEGLKIAHTAFFGPAEGGMETAQQQNTRRSNDIPWYIPSAISIQRANNIEFSDNYFFGLGQAGIHIVEAADGTKINGNAFSDIGDAAIAVGRHEHGGIGTTYESVQVVPPDKSGPLNLIDEKTKVASSYYDNFGVLAGTVSWYEESMMKNLTDVWSGDPYAAKNGEKNWIRYDFDAPYNITKVIMGFANSIPAEKKCGYEILLSNDREFAEGNYITAAEQISPAGQKEEYDLSYGNGKYRYMMIRSKEPGSFSVSSICALTNDRHPFTSRVPTKNTTITNNYITRSGETICSGGGISCFYTTGLELCDNEIYDIPYSGLMFGWGWRNNANGSGNNHIARNYIHSTNNTMHDGAAVYMLSEQKGTVVEENYIRDVFIGAGAFYPDEGSAYSIWQNNVSEDVFRNYNIWMSTIKENKFISSYGWHNINRNDGTNNVLETINEYLPGQDDPRAYEIKKNAGLKGEYLRWHSIVPQSELEVEEERVILDANSGIWGFFENYITYVSKAMLEKGSFGNMPGDYPMEYKYKLQAAYDEVSKKSGGYYVESLLKLRRYINEAADRVIRIPLDELIEMCEENIENTPVSNGKSIENSVTAKEKKAFSDNVSEIKKKAGTETKDGERFALLKRLEAEYRDFESKKAGFGIRYLWAEGMTGEEKDDQNRSIKIYMPANADLTECKTEIVCEGTAKAAVYEEYLDYSKEFKLPVYSPSLKRYEFWTVIPVTGIDDGVWKTAAEETNKAVRSSAGRTYLSISKAPYLYGKYFDKDAIQSVRFIPRSGADKINLSFIFGANSADDFEIGGKEERFDHFRLETDGDTASVIEHTNGEDIVLKSGINIKINNNVQNEIRVRVFPVAERCVIVIWVNGELKVNVLARRQALTGHIGFYNLKTGIEVME